MKSRIIKIEGQFLHGRLHGKFILTKHHLARQYILAAGLLANLIRDNSGASNS